MSSLVVKDFLKKVLQFSESDWIGGIDEIVNKILLNNFQKVLL